MNSHGKFTAQGDAYLNTVDELSGGKCINVYNPEGARYKMIRVMWGDEGHWVTLCDGDLCFDPWVGKIVKLYQPKWRVTNDRRWFKMT